MLRDLHQRSKVPTAFVIDDDDSARESICALLKAMNVECKVFASASEFLAEPTSDSVGCIVTDVRMPGISGLELTRQLHSTTSNLPVIVISAYIDVAGTVEAMKLGAVTVLTKPFDDQQLWESIQTAFAQSKAQKADALNKRDVASKMERLSEDELTVAECLYDGMLNKVIAAKLGVSVRTVEDRRRRIMAKLEVDSLAAFLRLYHDAKKLQSAT